jgi:pimeloyl-ACP methyl ester carboxylesterase
MDRPAPPAAASGLDGLFTARVRFGAGAALADTTANVVFEIVDAGRCWTVRVDRGRVSLQRGGSRHARSRIRTDADTMRGVLLGELSGVEAFLDGRLTMRGDISLALQVDGAFDVGRRPPQHPRARLVSAGGVRTSYLEAGPADGPRIVLLHGLGATNASMLPLLARLAPDFRVLAPDTPGFGASQAPRWRYTMAELADWFLAFSRAVGADRPAVVGNSLGGRIAIEAGLQAPDRLHRIALLCPSPAFRRLRQFVPLVRVITPDIGWLPLPLSHRLVVESIRMMFSRPDRLPRAWYDAAADDFRLVMHRAGHRRAFLACLGQIYTEEAYGERGFWDRLPGLRVPVLAVWGERDRLVPARFAHHVTVALPDSVSRVLPDCGHVPQFEWPEETATLVREFLSEEPPGAAGRRRPARPASGSRAG